MTPDRVASPDRAAERAEPIYVWYFVVQAVVGVGLWVALAGSDTIRSWFELRPGTPAVMDAFVFADVIIVVVGSLLSAWALHTGASWAVPVVAFTAGGVVYPTLYLAGWVSFTGTGALCLAVMLPPSTLTCWIAYQTYRTSPGSRRSSSR